eukprot:m51a1_g5206 hypothetical protein (752) ;mRNA; f:221321-224424
MSFLAKLKPPSNPVDQPTQDSARSLAQRVSSLFSSNYAASVREVLIEDAEHSLERAAKRRAKAERHARKESERRRAEAEEETEALAAAVALARAQADAPEGEEERSEGHEERRERLSRYSRRPCARAKPRRPRAPEQVLQQAAEDDSSRSRRREPVAATVVLHETLDADFDPYVSYVIVSYLKGGQGRGTEGIKSRRYKEFKALQKKLGTSAHVGALPRPSSKFGTRNLNEEFIEQRSRDLQKFLSSVCAREDSARNDALLHFLGLSRQEDQRDERIFSRAFEKTKADLGLWRNLTYDDHADAVSRLAMCEVKRTLWAGIESACPLPEAVRKGAMRAAYRSLAAVVTPVCSAAWEAVQCSSKETRKLVLDVLAQNSEEVVKAKAAAKAALAHELRGRSLTALEPAAFVLDGVLSHVLPVLVRCLAVCFDRSSQLHDDMVEALIAGNNEQLRAILDRAGACKDQAVAQMKQSLASIAGGLVAEYCPIIAGTGALEKMLEPLSSLPALLEAAAAVVDPRYWTECVRVLLCCKAELAMMDPAELTASADSRDKFVAELNRRLDRSEYDAVWWAGSWGCEMLTAARALWMRLAPSLGCLADVFLSLCRSLQDRLHRRPFKKFAYKFGDYVWAAASDPSDTREWKARVDAAFLVGYRLSLKCAQKQLPIVAREFAVDFVERPLFVALDAWAAPRLRWLADEVLEPVPQAIRAVVDVEGLLHEAVRELIGGTCREVLGRQAELVCTEIGTLAKYHYY